MARIQRLDARSNCGRRRRRRGAGRGGCERERASTCVRHTRRRPMARAQAPTRPGARAYAQRAIAGGRGRGSPPGAAGRGRGAWSQRRAPRNMGGDAWMARAGDGSRRRADRGTTAGLAGTSRLAARCTRAGPRGGVSGCGACPKCFLGECSGENFQARHSGQWARPDGTTAPEHLTNGARTGSRNGAPVPRRRPGARATIKLPGAPRRGPAGRGGARARARRGTRCAQSGLLGPRAGGRSAVSAPALAVRSAQASPPAISRRLSRTRWAPMLRRR